MTNKGRQLNWCRNRHLLLSRTLKVAIRLENVGKKRANEQAQEIVEQATGSYNNYHLLVFDSYHMSLAMLLIRTATSKSLRQFMFPEVIYY